MELTPVVSSNIASVGYDVIQNILFIRFKGKETVYPYYGVPVETYEEMMSAPSIGSFYAKNIKGRFPNEPQEDNGGSKDAGND